MADIGSAKFEEPSLLVPNSAYAGGPVERNPLTWAFWVGNTNSVQVYPAVTLCCDAALTTSISWDFAFSSPRVMDGMRVATRLQSREVVVWGPRGAVEVMMRELGGLQNFRLGSEVSEVELSE